MAQNRIAVITTGGTIGSVLGAGGVGVQEGGSLLQAEVSALQTRLGYEIDVIEALTKNSEDFSPHDWQTIIQAVNMAVKNGYSSIVLTHGTDTLAYTAAALSCLAHLWPAKICLTGAFYSPDQANSDASLNLQAALETVVYRTIENGVYLAFRKDASNTTAIIARAEDVKPMAYDEEAFHTLYGSTIADYMPGKGFAFHAFSAQQYPPLAVTSVENASAYSDAAKRVCQISLYPGLDFDQVTRMTDAHDIVVLSLFHAGTGPSSDPQSALIQYIKTREQAGKLTLLAAFPEPYITVPYTSTVNLVKAGAMVLNSIQPHYLYVYSVLSIAHRVSLAALGETLLPFRVTPQPLP